MQTHTHTPPTHPPPHTHTHKCSCDNKSKRKSFDCGLLSLTCIQFEKRFEYLRKTTEFWVYATTYMKGLSCYFMKQRYLAYQKTLIQSVSFLIPLSIPLLYTVCEGKILLMGECLWGGRESKVREPERQMGLIKCNIIFMWYLSLQWSVKQMMK